MPSRDEIQAKVNKLLDFFTEPGTGEKYLKDLENDLMHLIDEQIREARIDAQIDYRGEINQEFVKIAADNPNLDKEVVNSAIWIMNGRMAEKEAERQAQLSTKPLEGEQ